MDWPRHELRRRDTAQRFVGAILVKRLRDRFRAVVRAYCVRRSVAGSSLAANLPLFRTNLCPLTFLEVPELAYSRAALGVYEMTRVELLRDLYVWIYERSTQEYLAIKQVLAEPDPLRLAWRELIKETIRDVVSHPDHESLNSIQHAVASKVPGNQRGDLQAMIVEDLRRIHEGVLVRYRLKPSELLRWKGKHRL